MNIIRRHKLVGSLIFAVGLLISTAIEAHGGWGHHGGGWGHHGGGWGHHGGGWGHHGGGWGWGHGGGWGYRHGGPGFGVFIGPNIPYYHCVWVPGHWQHGYWIPPQRICS